MNDHQRFPSVRPAEARPDWLRQYMIFRDRKGNRFVIPPGWIDADTFVDDEQSDILREFCAYFHLEVEAQPLEVRANSRGFFELRHVVVALSRADGGYHNDNPGLVVWLISGPEFDKRWQYTPEESNSLQQEIEASFKKPSQPLVADGGHKPGRKTGWFLNTAAGGATRH